MFCYDSSEGRLLSNSFHFDLENIIIMNRKVLHTLEYDKIIEMLKAEATCTYSEITCERLRPMTNKEDINKALHETSDAISRLLRFDSFSVFGITNPKDILSRLELNGSLNCTELLSIASLLESSRRAISYGSKLSNSEDSLSELFNSIVEHKEVLNEINRCITGIDEYANDASVELSNIRRKQLICNDKIKSTLSQMLNNANIRTYLQDTVITMRSGRYCLPVRADSKNYVPGMVHDQSATGSTFFIEPMAVVDLNNELKELSLKEAEEIEKILYILSEKVAIIADDVQSNFLALAKLDFIFAKGKLALKMNASKPVFNDDGIIYIRQARHPLLSAETVVPVDIKLGEDYNLLLITGPNTGGKTVSLKTCGLLCLMAQAGLHIPAKDRSTLPLFNEIYADIGDEQSIEQSLSTFSSHMTNITRIINNIDIKRSEYTGNDQPRFLVLFDELCAGTDPKEGAALAEAILNHLHNSGVHTMATTHYSELKLYALSTDGVENASFEFSLETLSPTYRLIVGVPGKSNAFAISKKLGLSDYLIEEAKKHLSDDQQSFEDILIDLEQKRLQIDLTSEEISKKKADIEKREKDLIFREEKITNQKDKLIRAANEEASQIIAKAKEIADATIRDFNKYANSNPDIQKMEKQRAELGQKLNEARSKSVVKNQPVNNTNAPKEVHIGDKVKVLSMNVIASVVEAADSKGNITVQAGIIKSKVKLNDLVLIMEDDPYKPKKGASKKNHSYGGINKAATISPEINLLGCTVDEAIARLEKYLDDAYISHLTTVRVVHGKGTGALRSGVHQYLRKNKQVSDFHLAEFGEGDAGVTIVTFK